MVRAKVVDEVLSAETEGVSVGNDAEWGPTLLQNLVADDTGHRRRTFRVIYTDQQT